MKQLSKEKLEELRRIADEKYPSDSLVPTFERKAHLSCAKEYELKIVDKDVEISDLKTVIREKYTELLRFQQEITRLKGLIEKLYKSENYMKMSSAEQKEYWERFQKTNNL